MRQNALSFATVGNRIQKPFRKYFLTLPDVCSQQNVPRVEIYQRSRRYRCSMRSRRSRVLAEKNNELRRGNQQFDCTRRLCKLAGRQKQNERTRQTRILREALGIVNHCADSAIDVNRKAVSRKYFQARDVLQSKFQRHEHHF